MGIETVYTCDCCGAPLASSSILDCITVTAMVPNSQITQTFYGLACGCAAAAQLALTQCEAGHASHAPQAEGNHG